MLHACMLSCFSCIWLFVTPWTVAHQALLCMGFSKQKYWSGLPCPPLGDLPDPGIEPASPTTPALQADSFLLGHWDSLVYLVAQLPPTAKKKDKTPKKTWDGIYPGWHAPWRRNSPRCPNLLWFLSSAVILYLTSTLPPVEKNASILCL